ncbi:MAG: hypothetical protein U0168_13255 [Nannocystaceae bacterium]
MRPLTFGVVLSVGATPGFGRDRLGAARRTAAGPAAGGGPSPRQAAEDDAALAVADRRLEASLDLRSATDLAFALRELGHGARVLAADEDLDLSLRAADVDACLLALHGRAGGRGEVQSLLGVRGIPYFGPGAAAVALAFDKVRARQMLAYHNVPVLPAVALGRDLRASERALALLGWPCVVKPRRGAHGMGVTPLHDVAGVRTGIERALAVDEDILLERAAAGTEVQVVLLGERVLGSAELVGRDDAGADVVCPPRLSRGRLDGIHNIARRATAALGLQDGLTRVDLIAHDRHNEVVLEVEPLPSLAKDGVVARVARAAGLAYPELVGELLDRLILRVPETRASAQPVLLQ